MKNPEKFNPFDEKYKSHADLPPQEKDNFKETQDGGFVKDSAEENIEIAHEEAGKINLAAEESFLLARNAEKAGMSEEFVKEYREKAGEEVADAFLKLEEEKKMTEHYIKETIRTILNNRRNKESFILSDAISKNPYTLSKLEGVLGAELIREKEDRGSDEYGDEIYKTMLEGVVLVKKYRAEKKLNSVVIAFSEKPE